MGSSTQLLSLIRRFSPTRLFLLVITCSLLILLPTWYILDSTSAIDSPAIHNALWAPGGVQRSGPVGARAALHQYKEALDDITVEEPAQAKLAGYSHNKDLEIGNVIMPTFKNETAKAELGRASWKLLREFWACRLP